jgi:hypothetical protein
MWYNEVEEQSASRLRQRPGGECYNTTPTRGAVVLTRIASNETNVRTVPEYSGG